MLLLQISDENTGKIIEKSFATSPDTVYGVLVGLLLLALGLTVWLFLNQKKRADDANERVIQITQSSYESLAQMNTSQTAKVLEMASDLAIIKNLVSK